jgi:hypothetical protein
MAKTREKLTPREKAALDACARVITERRLTVPAIMLLSAMRPVSRVAAVSAQFALPWIEALVPGENARTMRDILERPDGMELVTGLLTERLDVLDRA